MIKYFLSFLLAFNPIITNAQVTTATKQELVFKNIMDNPGFENDRASWKESGGTFATVNSGSNLLTGRNSATWDSSAASQTLTSRAVTIPNGLYGQNGIGYCKFLTPSGTATHTISVFDGTNTLASATITSSTIPQKDGVNFIFPSSGSLSIRITSVASDEPLIAIDDCYLGEADNLTDVSQAEFVGSIEWAITANCDWSRNNAAFGNFTNDTDCDDNARIASGSVSDISAGLRPAFGLSGQAGNYVVVVTSLMGPPAAAQAYYRLFDGTTQLGQENGIRGDDTTYVPVLHFSFTRTTNFNNATIDIQARSVTASAHIDARGAGLKISVYRYPLASQIAVKADTTRWLLDLNISGANISLGTSNQAAYITPNNASLTMTVNTSKGSAPAGISCSSTNDNTVGATTCSSGNEEPGFVANFPRAGLVEVCYQFSHAIGLGANGVLFTTFQAMRTANGSQTITEEGGAKVRSGGGVTDTNPSLPHTNCGTFQIPNAGKHTIRLMYEQGVGGAVTSSLIVADASATAGNQDLKITARYIDQSMPAPLIRQTVVTNSDGVYRLLSAKVSSTDVVSDESGDWINGNCTNATTGFATCNFVSGIFSATPNCQCTIGPVGGSGSQLSCFVDVNSSSSITLKTTLGATSATDLAFILTCMGPR